MVNQIELITKYSPMAWDEVYKQEAVTSILDANKELVKFTGTKTVKIGKFQAGGLQDYYRNNAGDVRVPGAPGEADFYGSAGFGYQQSPARLIWEEFTLKQDRAAAYAIEKFDNEESGEQLITMGVKEISRTILTPEIDAYALSTIASYCTTELGNLVSYELSGNADSDKPLQELNKAFVYFAEHEVPIQDQVVFCSPAFMNALRNTKEVTKFLGQSDFDNKGINFVITKYEGRMLIETSPERLRTNIVLGNGFSWGADSKAINFLMVAKSAVTHVVKYEKIKVIGDDLNLAGNGFDGYTIYVRIYHDVFVPDNKRIALYCSVNGTVGAPTAKVDLLLNADNTIKAITTTPAEKIAIAVKSSKEETIGSVATGTLTNVFVGDTVSKGDVIYTVDNKKVVLAKYTVK
jgi:hypothetical protein